MNVFVGWDGGGTKTTAVVLDEKGAFLETYSSGALNSAQSIPETVAVLTSRLNQFHVLGLMAATAGISNPQIMDLLRPALSGYPAAFCGDQEAALRGAVGEVGAVIVAGTGSICCGRNEKGETARSGGMGYLFDDEGSGYALGRDLLAAVARDMDGRGCKTALRGLLAQEYGLKTQQDLVRYAYGSASPKQAISRLAPLISQAKDDPAAQAILRRGAKELALLGKAVVQRLGLEEQRVALMGSVLIHIQELREMVAKSLHDQYPSLQIVEPLHDAAYGAALLAIENWKGGYLNA